MNRSTLFDEIEQFYGRRPFGIDRSRGRDLRTIDVDVAEHDDEFVVATDLPGYDREDIEVRVTDDRIAITAERDAETDHAAADRDDATPGTADGSVVAGDEAGRYLRRERRHESVTRTVDLPSPVAETDATATYRHGVLTVTLPKAGAAVDDGHRIDVS